MSKRRLDKLEGSLFAKEAVLHWLGEAHGFGSLSTYVESLIEQPESAQPFVALPSQVSGAVWESMRRERPGFIKKVTREAVADTIFLLRLVIGINVHVEETLRIEGLRHTALVWWSRALDSTPRAKDDARAGGRSDWRRGVDTHRGVLLGTERARAAAEARHLDGHDPLFPELATSWRDLCAAAELLAEDKASLDEPVRSRAEQDAQQVVRMARADALDAAGQRDAADSIAARVARTASGGEDHRAG